MDLPAEPLLTHIQNAIQIEFGAIIEDNYSMISMDFARNNKGQYIPKPKFVKNSFDKVYAEFAAWLVTNFIKDSKIKESMKL